ncbi:condensation domain-containing protein, partial [Streptomyces sp. 13-12-16]|uniref:condensation domain-containing protein n=1 Tax=Streptomyces sp. 13-12-16 TaxID=1570823 RepID=UPI0015C4751E
MPDSRTTRLPLTAAQSGMWYAQRLDPDNPIYNGGQYWEIVGQFDPDVFEQAVRCVIRETDALRTRFIEDQDGVRQIVEEDPPRVVRYLDVSREPDPRAAAEEWMRADLARPVDLATASPADLSAFALIEMRPDHFLWYFRCHHIVLDGYGSALVARRVAEVHTALVQGAPVAPGDWQSLRDLVHADEEYRSSARHAQDRAYWRARLEDRPAVRSLAGRTAPMPHRLGRVTGHLTPELTARLRDMASRAAVPWPPALTAAFAAYLQNLTGGEDIVVGLPVTARVGQAARATPGMLSNVLPVRLRMSGDTTFTELLTQVSTRMRAALKHQRHRYEDMRRDLGLVGEDEQLVGPQVNIMLFGDRPSFAGVPATPHTLNLGPVRDLSAVFQDQGDGEPLRIDFEANPALYSEDELTLHRERFLSFVERLVAAGADRPLGALDAMLPGERARSLDHDADDAPVAHPDRTLVELFEEQVVRCGDRVAVCCGEESVTYAELNGRANRLARWLVGRGVGPEDVVAVCLPRSVDLVV